MYTWDVHVVFGELPAAHAEHVARVDAGSMHVAVYRALREVRRKLKGRRITTAKLTILRSRFLGELELRPAS